MTCNSTSRQYGMQPPRSTHLQCTNVLPTMDSPKSVLHPPTNEPFFYMAVKESQSGMPRVTWEAILNQEAVLVPCSISQAPGDDVSENPPSDAEKSLEERGIVY